MGVGVHCDLGLLVGDSLFVSVRLLDSPVKTENLSMKGSLTTGVGRWRRMRCRRRREENEQRRQGREEGGEREETKKNCKERRESSEYNPGDQPWNSKDAKTEP